MRKNQKINVKIYKSEQCNNDTVSALNEYHVKFIECCLDDLDVSSEQKICIIDKIIENLKTMERKEAVS